MNRLRVGVVGVGIGRIHLNAYQTLAKEVEVKAVCDVNQARLAEIGDEYNVPLRYTDYQDLFTSGEVDAVSICLPNNLHVPVSIAALEAGVHVLCEKPLAENAASGQKLVDVAEKAAAKFMICFNRRHRPDVQWMKEVVKSGRLGRIYQVRAGWTRETGIPARTGWFINKEVAGGGPLIDLGVHILDVVLWLLDYPKPLTVSGDVQANFGPEGLKIWRKPGDVTGALAYGVEDSATAFIRLADGASLNLETSWASHARPGMDDMFVTLLGTAGTLEWYVANYASKETLTLFTEVDGAPVAIKPRVVGERSDHLYAVSAFIKAIQEDRPPSATAEQGLTVMKIIDAIYQSADSCQEISLA